MVSKGVNPEILLAGGYGHKLHVWDLPKRRHLQELDLGPEQQMALELHPAHDPTARTVFGEWWFRSKIFPRRSGYGIATTAHGESRK